MSRTIKSTQFETRIKSRKRKDLERQRTGVSGNGRPLEDNTYRMIVWNLKAKGSTIPNYISPRLAANGGQPQGDQRAAAQR